MTSAKARRRRAVLLLALALAAGGLAASRVQGRAAAIERQVGPLVPVLVAGSDLPVGRRIGARALEVRQVPQRFAPPDSLAAPEQAIGRRVGAPVAAGGYLTHGAFEVAEAGGDEGQPGAPLRNGQRAIELAVAGGQELASAAPGTRVDVLVTTEGRSGSGRSFLALQDVELLAVREAGGETDGRDGAAANATAVATLRVRLRDAVYLTAAQSFARELRLLVRAPGDRGSAPPLAVDGGRL
jgi:pilus assembly protein CpaB